MKTNTANVVVSYIGRPLQEVITFIKSGARENNNYLFRISNDNIIKFTHSYNFDKSQGDDIGNKITLETIDPEGVFETTLFGNSGELGYSDELLSQLREDALKNIQERIALREKLDKFDFSKIGFAYKKDYGLKKEAGFFDAVEEISAFTRTNVKGNAYDDANGVTLNLGKSSDYQPDLATELNAVINDLPLTNLILNKLKEKKVYSRRLVVEETTNVLGFLKIRQAKEIDDVTGTTGVIGARERLQELSFSSIYSDLNLNVNLNDASVLPTPYFYFYYGIGDNPNQWSGPIASQLTNARYNYSVENGKKSIEMEFATTYNFPAFSKLSLDKRGFLTSIAPKFRGAQVFEGSPTSNAKITKKDSSYLHQVVTGVISDYIKTAVNNDKINVLVLIPDIDKIINKLIPNYFDAYTTSSTSDTFEVDARKINMYCKMFNEIGFATAYLNINDIETKHTDVNQFLGEQVDLKKNIKTVNSPVSFGDEASLSQFFNFRGSPNYNKTLFCLSLKKNDEESFKAPLERIMAGISNKLFPGQMCFELIDNLQFVKAYKTHLKESYQIALSDSINSDYPLIIFGDRFLIEKYVYGKKYYEIEQLVESRRRTSTKDEQLGLSYTDQLKKYANELKDTNSYLTDKDSKIFNNKYIIDIASKWFLKRTEIGTLAENSFYSFPTENYELSQPAIDRIRKASLPIFKSGISESNVLSLDLNLNDFYFAMLKSVWQNKDSLNLSLAANANNIDPKQLDAFSPDNVVKLKDAITNITLNPSKTIDMATVFNIIGNDQTFNDTNLTAEKKGQQLELLIQYLAQQLSSSQNSSNPTQKAQTISVVVGSHESVNPYIQYLNMFSRVVNNAFTGYIKSLPVFYLTGTSLSLPPIILLLEETNLPPYDKKNFITRSFNGMWSILGYKHTISSDDMSSEFWVVKDIRLEIPLAIQPRRTP
jgi:hypothetical protein